MFLQFSLAYQFGRMDAEARINALALTRLIDFDPVLWDTGDATTRRVGEVIAARTMFLADYPHSKRVVSNRQGVVAETGGTLEAPVVRRAALVFGASGEPVGAITVTVSARPIFLKSGLVALGSLAAAGVAFGVVRFLPLRALERALRDLRRAKAKAEARRAAAEAARVRAELADRAKSEFLATMSHELRTPLNAVIGFSQVIQDAMMGPLDTRYRDYARDIHNSGTHLLSLINDILDYSKIESGRLELSEEPVDLAVVVASCCRLVAPRAEHGQVNITADVPRDLPPVVADERRLKQVLLNRFA
jgi:signal transduction histidine kinase